MAQLLQEQVLKKEVQTVAEFAKTLNLAATAVYYAINNDLVDHVTIGTSTFVVLTSFTKQYKPNSSPRRKKVSKKKKK